MMYNKIYDFCKIRNVGSIFKNDPEIPTPRVRFLLDLLDSEQISYELDKFKSGDITGYNIIMKGTSTNMVVAHHDIVNPNIDNANDNSASVINAIMIKKLSPETNVVLLDGEELSGYGSQRVSEQINNSEFNQIDWVLNLELTGRGGKNFFVGDYPGVLNEKIKSIFDCPQVRTPFNDSVIFRKNGIDSCVVNPLPIITDGSKSNVKYGDNYLDFDMLYNCHSERDTLDTINVDDMKEFVEEVVLKILK